MAASDAYTPSSSTSGRPAKRDRQATSAAHFSSAVVPGTRLVAAIAPALTRALAVRSAFSSTAITELNGIPVPLTPRRSRASAWPRASTTSAKANTFETLWMENSRSASPTAATSPDTPATQAPNQRRVGRAQRGDVVGDRALVDVAVALVGRLEQRLDLARPRQAPGGGRRGRRGVVR